MKFDFTTLVDRREYPSKKWTLYPDDVLPLWVADMDFPVAPAITEALKKRVIEHPVYGYVAVPETLEQSFCEWSRSHHGWEIRKEWQCWLSGGVPALHLAALALSDLGEELMLLTPIYPPFLGVGKITGRLSNNVPMLEPTPEHPYWRLDKEGMENAVTDKTRLLMWCNPHNPTGRVFTTNELEWLADFIERHDLLVCSDELHCDLVLDKEAKHIPLASLDERIANRTLTLWAASKTFNVAGLPCSCAIIPNPQLREKFLKICEGLQPSNNALSLVATEAAYSEGEEWRQGLLEVLRDNRNLLMQHVAQWPNANCIPPQGSYLSWIDLRKAGLGDDPQKTLLEKTRVGLSDGKDFDAPGFVRLNLGTQHERLQEALERLDTLLKQ